MLGSKITNPPAKFCLVSLPDLVSMISVTACTVRPASSKSPTSAVVAEERSYSICAYHETDIVSVAVNGKDISETSLYKVDALMMRSPAYPSPGDQTVLNASGSRKRQPFRRIGLNSEVTMNRCSAKTCHAHKPCAYAEELSGIRGCLGDQSQLDSS